MADDLTVEFWGLCAYLLYGKDKNASVLLVRHHHPHTPKLMVDFSRLTNKEDIDRFPVNNGLVGWLDFTGHDVTVKPGGATAKPDKLVVKNATGKKKGCPGTDKDDLAWLPNINELSTAPSQAGLNTDPIPSTHVLSRFHLTEGHLWTKAHAADKGVVRKFQFATDDPAAIASASLYTVAAHTPIAILSFERGGKPDFEISLNVPASVVVTHLPSSNSGTMADHFDAFYDLVNGGVRPEPIDVGPCAGAVGWENEPRRPCPQGMLRLP